jgi:hypothetical protein
MAGLKYIVIFGSIAALASGGLLMLSNREKEGPPPTGESAPKRADISFTVVRADGPVDKKALQPLTEGWDVPPGADEKPLIKRLETLVPAVKFTHQPLGAELFVKRQGTLPEREGALAVGQLTGEVRRRTGSLFSYDVPLKATFGKTVLLEVHQVTPKESWLLFATTYTAGSSGMGRGRSM